MIKTFHSYRTCGLVLTRLIYATVCVLNTDSECGVCSWLCDVESDRPVFVTSHRCIRVKNTFGWSAVVFCASEIMQMFSFVVELWMNLTSGCVKPWHRLMCLTGSVRFPQLSSLVQASCILLSKGTSLLLCVILVVVSPFRYLRIVPYFLFPLLCFSSPCFLWWLNVRCTSHREGDSFPHGVLLM
jgi:hypothetical protein